MVTKQENDLLTRVEGDAPMGRLMRENYWIPFALSSQLGVGDVPLPVRLLGDDFVAFRAADGRIGFLDERCPHRRASLLLGRVEDNAIRCIYHGWKIDASGEVVDCPTQTSRAEQFAASVTVERYPVHEAGGLAWVWLGAAEQPPFPTMPFVGDHEEMMWVSVSLAPCNWLQGIEGTLDSAHVGTLHQSWIKDIATTPNRDNIGYTLERPPRYETYDTPYGLRAAALRDLDEGKTYARVTEYFMPFVCLAPGTRPLPRDGFMFIVAPVDDEHHLLFYGVYSDQEKQIPEKLGLMRAGLVPDINNFASLTDDRTTRWGQDRDLIAQGHFTGFDRTLIQEDMVVIASMGPIVDRSAENLSSSDVAVAATRRMLLDALAGAPGSHPPGSALAPEPVEMVNPLDVLLEAGKRWQDFTFDDAPAPVPT
jgi:nitrite reductase/ring-hydroxylating ferredoxin subunit